MVGNHSISKQVQKYGVTNKNMRLAKYIYEHQRQGFSDAEIYQLLEQGGWLRKDIDEAFEGAERLRRFDLAIKNPITFLKKWTRFFISFFISLPFKIFGAGSNITAFGLKYVSRAVKYIFINAPSVISHYLSARREIKKRNVATATNLASYIEKNLKAGAIENDILVALLKSGWEAQIIDKAFAKAHWAIVKENSVLFTKTLILFPFVAIKWLAKEFLKIIEGAFVSFPLAIFNALKYTIISAISGLRYFFWTIASIIRNFLIWIFARKPAPRPLYKIVRPKLSFKQKVMATISRIKYIFSRKSAFEKEEEFAPILVVRKKISLKTRFLLTVNSIKYFIKSYPSALARFHQRISAGFAMFMKKGAGKIIKLPVVFEVFIKYEFKFYLKNIFFRYPAFLIKKLALFFKIVGWRGLIEKIILFVIKIIFALISLPFILIKKLFLLILALFKKMESDALSPILDVTEYGAEKAFNTIKKALSPIAKQITAIFKSLYRLAVPLQLEPSYLPQALSEVPIGEAKETMSVFDVLKIASRMFKTRRMRTFLTILGIGIGIGAILFLVSLGYGLQKILVEEIATSDALLSLDVSTRDEILIPLNKEALDKMSGLPEISYISPLVAIPGQVTLEDVTANTMINGIMPSYFKLSGISTKVGQAFKEGEEENVLISLPLVRLLTLGQTNGDEVTKEKMESLLGKNVEIILLVTTKTVSGFEETQTIEFPIKFTIGGVIEDSAESLIYFPISHIENAGITNYQSAKIKVVNSAALEIVRAQAIDMGYIVAALSDTIEQANKVFQVLQIVLAMFGIVALIVSAIGMFNTMTIALLERTQEIGIMKSLGASNGNIWGLFLTESIIMGFLGGMAGIAIGYIGSEGFNLLVRILASALGGKYVQLFERPWWFIITIVTFSTAVGLFTGLWPAKRAANIKILTALRYK